MADKQNERISPGEEVERLGVLKDMNLARQLPVMKSLSGRADCEMMTAERQRLLLVLKDLEEICGLQKPMNIGSQR